MSELSEYEKDSLKQLLENPILKKAMDAALVEIWRKRRGVDTLEASAMAFNYFSGASEVLVELHALADVKKEDFSVGPRKLKHTL